MEHYKHRQIGWIGIVASLLIFEPPVILLLQSGVIALPAVILVAQLLLVFLFGTLTVRLDDESIEARLGVGVIRRRVRLADVSAYRVVRNPWFAGYGLRRSEGAELLNVSGRAAVEFDLRNDTRLRIGSDEPQEHIAHLGTLVVRRGTDQAETGTRETGRTPWSVAGRLFVVLAGIAIFVFALAGSRLPTVTVTADRLVVGSGLFKTQVPLSSITNVEMAQTLPSVRRKDYGYRVGSVLRGRFTLEQWGAGSVFADLGQPPFVVVHTSDTFVAIGLPDRAALTRVYEQLHH